MSASERGASVSGLPDGPFALHGVVYESLEQRVAEVIRSAGIDWHRQYNAAWRDKPWHDGITVDLDEDDVLGSLAAAAIAAVGEVLPPAKTDSATSDGAR